MDWTEEQQPVADELIIITGGRSIHPIGHVDISEKFGFKENSHKQKQPYNNKS